MTVPQHFGRDWIRAWNDHDVDAILSHYDDEVEFRSPFVIQLFNEPTGLIRGKSRLREYFATGLSRFPDLRFELYQELRGVDSVVLYYRSVKNLLAAETMSFGPTGKIVRVSCHYAESTSAT